MSKHGVSLNQLVLFQDSRPHDVSIYCIPQVTTVWNFSPANMCKALYLEILVTTWNQQWKWSPTSSAVDKTDGPRVLEDIGILLLTCSTGWLGRIDFAQLYWNDSDLLLMRIPWWQIGNSIGICVMLYLDVGNSWNFVLISYLFMNLKKIIQQKAGKQIEMVRSYYNWILFQRCNFLRFKGLQLIIGFKPQAGVFPVVIKTKRHHHFGPVEPILHWHANVCWSGNWDIDHHRKYEEET